MTWNTPCMYTFPPMMVMIYQKRHESVYAQNYSMKKMLNIKNSFVITPLYYLSLDLLKISWLKVVTIYWEILVLRSWDEVCETHPWLKLVLISWLELLTNPQPSEPLNTCIVLTKLIISPWWMKNQLILVQITWTTKEPRLIVYIKPK